MNAVEFTTELSGATVLQIPSEAAAQLPKTGKARVIVLTVEDADSEDTWLRAAASSDAFAFLADPAEDIYTSADGKPLRDAV